MNKNKIVRVASLDGLYLYGYFAPKNGKVALLHIHGFEGNFYENEFVWSIGGKLDKMGITFLTANTRGNGKDTNFNTTKNKIVRVGGHYESLDDAYLDIDAWIKFLMDEGYGEIYLQGHSLGTIKSVRYLFEGKYKDKVKKLILICPFDGKAMIDRDIKKDINELVKKAEEKVKQGKGEELASEEFETVGMSYKTYVSWYQRNDFGRMFEFCNKDYDFPLLQKIKIPTKVIVGSKDEFFHTSNPNHPEEAVKIMLDKIPNSEGKIIQKAPHSFIGFENELAEEMSDFVQIPTNN